MKLIPVGKGYFVWQIKRLYKSVVADMVIAAMTQGVSWIAVKFADGKVGYNRNLTITGWKDDLIVDFITQFHAAGIKVFGWQYVYLNDPVGEANFAATRLHSLNLDGMIIDAEGECANKPVQTRIYTQALRVALPDTSIGLCSYRYPSLHMELDWKDFLSVCDYHIPQVYWVQSHDPVAQTEKSYQELVGLKDIPFIPLGSAYKQENGTWIPSSKELYDFNQNATNKKYFGVGYYSWDDAYVEGLEPIIAPLQWSGVVIPPPPTITPVAEITTYSDGSYEVKNI